MIRGLVQADQYPSKEGFLDDDALNEHFDAWNAHHWWLQSISGDCLNMNMTFSNVFSNLQNCPITINLVVNPRSVSNLVLNA
jgi:hypothetical protein